MDAGVGSSDPRLTPKMGMPTWSRPGAGCALPHHMCTRTVRGIKPRHELARPIQGYPPSPQHLAQRFIHFGGRGGPSPGAARQPYGASSALICANSANSRKVAPGTLHKRAFRALTYQWMLGAYAHTYGASLPSLWDGGGARDSSPTAPRAPASRPRIRGEFVRRLRGKGHAKRHMGGPG